MERQIILALVRGLRFAVELVALIIRGILAIASLCVAGLCLWMYTVVMGEPEWELLELALAFLWAMVAWFFMRELGKTLPSPTIR